MKNKSHFGLWIAITIIIFIVIPFVESKESMIERMTSEVRMMSSVFGGEAAVDMVEDANSIHSKYIMGDVNDGISRLHAREEDKTPFAHMTVSAAKKSNRIIEGLKLNIYRSILRFNLLLLWIPAIAPFLIAVVVDGIVKRKITLYNYDFLSPTGFTLARHAIYPLLFLPIIYLIAPLPITPLFLPFWALLVAYPITMVISNATRMKA